jgi:hypothetical protein
VKSDLFYGPDQLIDVCSGIVIGDGRFPRGKIHAGGFDARNLREFRLDAPHAAPAGHARDFQLDIRFGHVLMIAPSGCDGAPFGPQDAILTSVARFTILVVFALASASGLIARDGSDPVFATIPFDQWLDQKQQTPIHWTLRISYPALSAHQRLGVLIEAQVDGVELARRRGEGKLLVLAQITDGKNRTWQNHVETDLEHVEEGIKSNNVIISQMFFVLPGDYRAAVAVFDTASGEHNVIKRTLHVAPFRNDPLPDLWRDLPPVEFFTPEQVPDRWFLPSIEGRLRLPVETHHPTEVSLLVNLTPAERFAASSRVQNRNLEELLPSTKVLSQVDWHNAKFSIELLDLSRRRVAFRQDDMQLLHWADARGPLTEVNAGTIDVKALANRRLSADFFLNEIAEKIQAPAAPGKSPRVVIILSASVFFEPGVEMHPIGVTPRPDVTVFYIRYQPLQPVRLINNPNPEVRPRGANINDQLAPLLKPLAPRLFDVTTPQEFRRSLAAILGQIAKL